MPACVRKKLVALQTKFLWGGNKDNRGITPIKRSIIELRKEKGGLGIGNLLHRNLALLFKWWWRFSVEGNPLWKRIVCSAHCLLDFKANSELFKECKWGVWGQFITIKK